MGPDAMWGECTSRPIHTDDFATWLRDEGGLAAHAVLVSLWTCDPTWRCVWERELDLRTAMPIGTDQTALVSHAPKDPTVFVSIRVSETMCEYFQVGLSGDRPSGKPVTTSCTWPDIERFVDVRTQIRAVDEDLGRLTELCAPAVGEGSVLAHKRHMYEQRHVLDCIRRARRKREHTLADMRRAIDTKTEALEARQTRLEVDRARIRNMKEACKQLHTEHESLMSDLSRVQWQQRNERARLLRELDAIYPIQLVNARDLLYSIVDVPLPNGIATTTANATALVHKTDLDDAAAALAYVAQLVILLSIYLHLPLPYPLTSAGSCATVQDRISMMSGPRMYVEAYSSQLPSFREEQ